MTLAFACANCSRSLRSSSTPSCGHLCPVALALVLAAEGFAAPPTGPDARAYSPENPPPALEEVRKLYGEDPTDMRKLQACYAGGWRAVPEGERWWEDALGGEIEERRKRNLELVKGVRGGTEGALGTYI